MSEYFSFNLVDEAWIPCILPDGAAVTLNLHQVFEQSHQLTAIIGDSPPVTVALHRFLLAILHRVFGPEDEEAWVDLWQEPAWDMDELNAYLDEWRHRFDLFDPKHPFYQASDKRMKSKSTISLSHDRASGNNPTLFDHHTEVGGETLFPAQAARLLLAGQAYGLAGLSGIKQKFTDGNCASGIIFLVQGNDLRQTLLLNMIKYPPRNDHFEVHTHRDIPAWEMDDSLMPERTYPLGYLDYLTWQNRRILFQPEETPDGIVVKQMTMGPALRYEPTLLDPMKNYRKHDKLGYLSLSFREDRTFWRDSATLFTFRQDEASAAHPPATLHWLRWLVEEMGYPQQRDTYRTLALGMSKKQAKVFFFRQEWLPMPVKYLVDDELVAKLETALFNAGTIAFDLIQVARLMGMHLQEAKVDEKWQKQWASLNVNAKGDINNWITHTGMERNYWAALDLPFQALIVDLVKDLDGALATWYAALRQAALAAFALAESCTGEDARAFKAVVKGESYLHYRLNEVLPNPEKEKIV